MTERGLYVHIPFCTDICSYCDFVKVFYRETTSDAYLEALAEEISRRVKGAVSSIYVGGGTPSALNETQFRRLLSLLSAFHREGNSFTLEANVESLNEEKIALLKTYGVNRISLGVQSLNEKMIALMNRHHDFRQVKETIGRLNAAGIEDINCDLIYALPGETDEILQSDLEALLSLSITHLSAYGLMINDHTCLKIRKYREADDETYRRQYDRIVSVLEENGLFRYEVSNFARKGRESQHNLLYWKNREYYGVGVGAASYIGDERSDNTHSLSAYLRGKTEGTKEKLTKEDRRFYHLMLGLRLAEGVDLEEYRALYGENLTDRYADKLAALKAENLIEIDRGHLKINRENLYIMDYVLKKLLF